MPDGSRLLFFVRWPEAGRVKTRLARSVGPEEACRLHKLLAEVCFREALEAVRDGVVVCATGAGVDRFREWLPGALDYWPQPEAGLGERLEAMFARAFGEGAQSVAAMGSDAPGLRAASIAGALRKLATHDVAILPALDGGYVLVGMRSLQRGLFREMPWSTAELFDRTREACSAAGLKLHVGPAFGDVDTEEDWHRWKGELE
jgi:uncharacterized protein